MIHIPTQTAREHVEASAQVLSVLTGGDDQWIDYRGHRFGAWLRARAITHGWCLVGDPNWLAHEISSRGARVVIAEAQSLPPQTIARLAPALPEVQFVTLLHGVPAWCASSAPELTYGAIRQARDIANVHVGVVSDPQAMAWLPGTKVVHLPNPIEIPATLQGVQPRGRSGDELCVSLVARPSPVKNWGGMLAALGLLAQRRKITAVVAGRCHTPNHRAHLQYLEDLGINAVKIDFGDWAETLKLVSETTHVGLACGYSDALNLVAAEHCLLGIPVVGSPALDWLPSAWRVSPQEPGAIADQVEILAGDRKAGALGRKIVIDLAQKNERLLLQNLSVLLAT